MNIFNDVTMYPIITSVITLGLIGLSGCYLAGVGYYIVFGKEGKLGIKLGVGFLLLFIPFVLFYGLWGGVNSDYWKQPPGSNLWLQLYGAPTATAPVEGSENFSIELEIAEFAPEQYFGVPCKHFSKIRPEELFTYICIYGKLGKPSTDNPNKVTLVGANTSMHIVSTTYTYDLEGNVGRCVIAYGRPTGMPPGVFNLNDAGDKKALLTVDWTEECSN